MVLMFNLQMRGLYEITLCELYKGCVHAMNIFMPEALYWCVRICLDCVFVFIRVITYEVFQYLTELNIMAHKYTVDNGDVDDN